MLSCIVKLNKASVLDTCLLCVFVLSSCAHPVSWTAAVPELCTSSCALLLGTGKVIVSGEKN